jgi:hypothetical protein
MPVTTVLETLSYGSYCQSRLGDDALYLALFSWKATVHFTCIFGLALPTE